MDNLLDLDIKILDKPKHNSGATTAALSIRNYCDGSYSYTCYRNTVGCTVKMYICASSTAPKDK